MIWLRLTNWLLNHLYTSILFVMPVSEIFHVFDSWMYNHREHRNMTTAHALSYSGYLLNVMNTAEVVRSMNLCSQTFAAKCVTTWFIVYRIYCCYSWCIITAAYYRKSVKSEWGECRHALSSFGKDILHKRCVSQQLFLLVSVSTVCGAVAPIRSYTCSSEFKHTMCVSSEKHACTAVMPLNGKQLEFSSEV